MNSENGSVRGGVRVRPSAPSLPPYAWGARPLWFLRTGVAGIRSAAPFFEKVRIAPQPGGLKSIKASYPHPSGKMIEVDLIFEAGKARGRITTPVAGEFVFGGVARPLVPGANEI